MHRADSTQAQLAHAPSSSTPIPPVSVPGEHPRPSFKFAPGSARGNVQGPDVHHQLRPSRLHLTDNSPPSGLFAALGCLRRPELCGRSVPTLHNDTSRLRAISSIPGIARAGAQEPSSVTQRPVSAVETSSKQPAGPKRSRSPSPQPEQPVNHKTAKAGAAGDGSLHGLTFRPAEALPASAALTGTAEPGL